jgi:hypothetical protein
VARGLAARNRESRRERDTRPRAGARRARARHGPGARASPARSRTWWNSTGCPPVAGHPIGNLLCAVAGLLDGLDLNGALTGAIANLLNAVGAALPGLGL